MELIDIESAIEEIQAIKTSKAQIDILWKIGEPKSEMYDILYKIESIKMQEAIKKTLAALEAAKVKEIGENALSALREQISTDNLQRKD